MTLDLHPSFGRWSFASCVLAGNLIARGSLRFPGLRIERILELIRKCEYSIHDLSMQTLDSDHGLPHFNMPFELGLLIGTVRSTQEHASKNFLIFDSEPDRLRLSCSDLKGYDPVHHSGKPDEIIRLTRDWLAEAAERDLYWPKPIIEEFAAFEHALPKNR